MLSGVLQVSEKEPIDLNTLRAELGNLELRLVDRLNDTMEKKADSNVVDQLDKRVSSLEISRAQREDMPKDIAALQEAVGGMRREADKDEGESQLKRYLTPLAVAAVGAMWWVPQFFHH